MRIKDKNKNVALPDAVNYNKLRELGIGYLQEIKDSVWTDYNLHDPGVSILELLCYSLVDLGYRTSFEMNDLLTQKGENHPCIDGSFFPAHEILSVNPITIEDYRKLILEHVPGVQNVRFETIEKPISLENIKGISASKTQVRGYYKVIIELKSDAGSNANREVVGRDENGQYLDEYEKNYSECYKKYILNLFLKHRNLCENIRYEDIIILKPIKVGICAQVEIKEEVHFNTILKQINSKLQEYVSPKISFYSLAEMIGKEKTPEEIYQGANPKYGFIDTEELKKFKQKTELYVSDALNLIMGIDGVKSISHLHFVVDKENFDDIDDFDYKMALKEGALDKYTFDFLPLDAPLSNDQENFNNVSLTINGIPLYGNKDMLDSKPETEKPSVDEVVAIEYPLPLGRYKHIDSYYSIQNELPQIYKLGRSGISDSASDLRKAERLQLKAYVLMFDQILADYLAQLSSLNKLLSWKDVENKEICDLTYFHKVLSEEEITDISKVLKDSSIHSPLSSDETNQNRRNRVLNHLLARFNEDFLNYSIFKFWNKTDSQKYKFDLSEAIKDKKSFLSQYAGFSSMRSVSSDYTENWEYSPIERRIMSKLGIDIPPQKLTPNYEKRKLASGVKYYFKDNSNESYNTTFGIHIIEHILLTPLKMLNEDTFLKLTEDDMGLMTSNDPYSMQLTVIVPGWLNICKTSEFRIIVEQIITEELPAHVSTKICWIDPYVMMGIENLYNTYFKQLKKSVFQESNDDEKEIETSLASLMEVIHDVRNIYQPTVLGLGNEVDMNNITRLNYSTLGEDDTTRSGSNWQFSKNNKKK